MKPCRVGLVQDESLKLVRYGRVKLLIARYVGRPPTGTDRGDPMGVRILVVEDEDEIADFLVRGLREEGFTVERANDGDEAWYALQTGSWDVVLLDWCLPGPDGLDLLRRY